MHASRLVLACADLLHNRSMIKTVARPLPSLRWTPLWTLVLLSVLAGCASKPPLPASSPAPSATPADSSSVPPDSSRTDFPSAATWPGEAAELPPSRQTAKSRWVPVRWSAVPGLAQDDLTQAWAAWMRSCEKPSSVFAVLCAEARRLPGNDTDQLRAWLVSRLQPYRLEPLQGGQAGSDGLLTGYYEPTLDAYRTARPGYGVPLYRVPANLANRKPWYTRQEIETLPEARAALAGREIAWVADPVDAMSMQIQGSGRLRVTEADGSQRTVRLAFAGTNDQPYKSIGRWLIDQGAVREASWPTIRAWISQNPDRVQAMLWSNPRVVFFREEALPADTNAGPRGAQGVPLTAGRSIAVDPQSIPYGTPVWLASSGPTVNLQRMVVAQDTGSAIVGAVRADYFVGSGFEAGQLAGKLKQSLSLWALWPR